MSSNPLKAAANEGHRQRKEMEQERDRRAGEDEQRRAEFEVAARKELADAVGRVASIVRTAAAQGLTRCDVYEIPSEDIYKTQHFCFGDVVAPEQLQRLSARLYRELCTLDVDPLIICRNNRDYHFNILVPQEVDD